MRNHQNYAEHEREPVSTFHYSRVKIAGLWIIMLAITLVPIETAEAQIKRWFFGSSEKAEKKPTPISERESSENESKTDMIYHIPMNHLDDLKNTLSHDYPEIFLFTPGEDESLSEEDPTAGFRIQLLSTRDVHLADSILAQFRVQSDSLFADYQPEAYLEFRQPYFKIHIGDFKDRAKAIQVARFLKRWYGDAWVVYDQIVPELVPADTLNILR